MEAVILAAGKSQRFGENKLLVKFNNLTLIEHSLKFLKENNIDDKIFIVINKSDIHISNKDKIIQPVIHSLLGSPYYSDKIEFVFQDPNEYGPGAALRAVADKISDDYIVLFGDNYYFGIIDISFGGSHAIATCKYLDESEENLRLAYAEFPENKIIEKPHYYTKGYFFCGYILMKKDTIKNAYKLVPSERNEYEITEFFNIADNRIFRKINCEWMDIAYASEVTKVTEYITETVLKNEKRNNDI